MRGGDANGGSTPAGGGRHNDAICTDRIDNSTGRGRGNRFFDQLCAGNQQQRDAAVGADWGGDISLTPAGMRATMNRSQFLLANA